MKIDRYLNKITLQAFIFINYLLHCTKIKKKYKNLTLIAFNAALVRVATC